MGKLEKIYDERLISESSDRHCNRLRIEKSNNGELHIHYRNLKITLIDPAEQAEWRTAFEQAREKFLKGDYLKNDI